MLRLTGHQEVDHVIKHHVTVAASVLAVSLGLAGGVQAATRVGTLTCNVAPGVGLLVASSKRITCSFAVNNRTEAYYGRITKVGLDVGITTGGKIVWAVFEPTQRRADLSGTYTGAAAEATAGVGAGANVLIGGSNRKISLQPLSVSGQTGLNLAAGIGSITLARGG